MIYVYDKSTARMVPKGHVSASRVHNVMSDIQPYQSMIDGHMVTSRSEHRTHLRDHGCIEVGNEKMETKLPPPIDTRREVMRQQLGNMTHKQANQILSQLRRKFT